MLSRMMSLEALLEAWKCILRSERFFQSWAFWFQRSLTLVCLERTKAHPSLWPLTPSGSPLVLVKDGFPKRGCLSISTLLVGSSLVRLGRTLIHAPRMFFHMEQGVLFSLGAAKIRLMSGVSGPFPWTGSLVWSAWCLIGSFQGSPSSTRPLTSNLARSASDWVLGLIMPSPPLAMGKVKVSHFTLAWAGVALPPCIKFLTTPCT